tara:strand:+ start:2837 stop:3469 length:633 start_codon:yes stop_codon:yes gene_type:complete
MDDQYRKLQEKIDAIARNEPLPPVNEEEGPYGIKDSNYEIIMGFVNQWTEAGQPDDYMGDLIAYVKKTIPNSKDWKYAASLIKNGVESYQNREYETSSLMGLRNNTESVEEAVAGGGVDDLYELLDMGISKEGLFDEWVAYSSSDDIGEFVDHFKQMHSINMDEGSNKYSNDEFRKYWKEHPAIEAGKQITQKANADDSQQVASNNPYLK